MGPVQSLDDLFGLVRRRFLLIAVVSLIGILISIAMAQSKPKVYQTAAVIQVETPKVDDGAGNSPANVPALQALQSIEQRLTTRDNLISLIERHGLFANLPAMSIEDKVGAMRGSIEFQSITSASGSGLSAIIIFARAETPELAARVANDLAQNVLDLGAEDRIASAKASHEFYQEEEARLWTEISKVETETKSYRQENFNSLPATLEARRDERLSVDSDLRDLEVELVGMQTELDELNAAQTQRATDRRRIEELTQQIAVLTAKRAPLIARNVELDLAVTNGAEVDRVLAAYDRQLRQLQDQYSVVSTKLAESDAALRLAERQQTERFALLERAIAPLYPTGSSAKKLFAAGAVASVLAGFALAFALDLAKPVIRTSSQLESQLNLRPIIAIPDLKLNPKRPTGKRLIASLVKREFPRMGSRTQLAAGLMLGVVLFAMAATGIV